MVIMVIVENYEKVFRVSTQCIRLVSQIDFNFHYCGLEEQ